MGRVELPIIPATTKPEDAFARMRAHRVSAGVVQVGETYWLLEASRLTEVQREWKDQPPSVAPLVRGRALPSLSEVHLDNWFRDPWPHVNAKTELAVPVSAQVVLLEVNKGKDVATVSTRFEWQASLLNAVAVQYECVADSSHVWDASDLGGKMECPSIAHPAPPPPRPRVRQI